MRIIKDLTDNLLPVCICISLKKRALAKPRPVRIVGFSQLFIVGFSAALREKNRPKTPAGAFCPGGTLTDSSPKTTQLL